MQATEADDDGHVGAENRLKPGKTFYKGRKKQIRKEKNPEQWNAYNKAPRIKKQVQHFNPLGDQLNHTRLSGNLSTKSLKNQDDNDDENDFLDINDQYLDAKSTHQILSMSKQFNDEDSNEEDFEQQKSKKKNKKNKKNNNDNNNNNNNKKIEIDTENKDNNNNNNTDNNNNNNNNNNKIINKIFGKKVSELTLEELLGNDEKDDDNNSILQSVNNDASFLNDIELTKDEQDLDLFMPKSTYEQMTLSDIIMKRIRQQEKDNISQLGPENIVQQKIPKQIINVYKEVGTVLSKWHHGKLPKAFKMIPILSEWEELLYITNPDGWSPHIVYEATKLFASQGKKDICQRFYNVILLPRVRRDIKENDKLNFHLYQAVRKSLFKSQAFFRGFFLPLCADECRAREAIIIGGIIAKNSIPVLQSAIAIYKLLDLEYSGATHHFLKIFLNKRYALPLKVIEKLVIHFKKFEHDPRTMPVVWHQALLAFVQRYKKSITNEQKASLKAVLKKQFHKDITPLIRKELHSNINTVTSMDIDI